MKSKAHFFAVALALLTTVNVFSQANNRTTAINYYKDFAKAFGNKDKEGAKRNILLAKEFIDKAAAHETTINDPKTLYYKGEIYLGLASLCVMDPDLKGQFDAEKLTEEAFASYKASLANKNKKDDFTEEISNKIRMTHSMAFNQSLEWYKEKKYKEAMEGFDGCIKLFEVIGKVDTLSLFKAGLCAELNKDYDNAIKYYKGAAENGYSGAQSYVRYITMLTEANKDAEQAIAQAKSKYPKDKDLTISELSYYLKKGDNEKAETALQQAVSNDPKNPVLYFSAGVVYDNLKKFSKAEEAYKKAIELKPDYADALFNLGAMYYNEFVDVLKALDNITDNSLYTKEKQKAEDRLKLALPLLEKVRTLNPNDKDNLRMLRTIYSRLNMQDKWKEVNDLLKN
jgi:tetratricopeptide (TPR) repeat protein